MPIIENMQQAMMLLGQRRASLEFDLKERIGKFLDENKGVKIDDVDVSISEIRNAQQNGVVRNIKVKVTLTI